MPTILYATLLAGQYTTPAIYAEVNAVFTNTAPVDAYRGAGRPEATYVVERIVEQAAREMRHRPGRDPAAATSSARSRTRRRSACTYDTGDYAAHLDKAMKIADVAGFAARTTARRRKGRKRGLGYACYIEACGIAPSNIAGALGARAGLFEAGEVRVHPTGTRDGLHRLAQPRPGPRDDVRAGRRGAARHPGRQRRDRARRHRPRPVRHGHLRRRSLAVGGTAIVKAVDKVIAKGKKIAAHLLEAADSRHRVRGRRVQGRRHRQARSPWATSRSPRTCRTTIPLDKLEPGLNENAFYDPTNFTYPAGTYICEVEVDPDTGKVKVEQFTAVDDFGNIINPMIVEGQVHGGIAQGIGQAMMEALRVRPAVGPAAHRLVMDYAMPRADGHADASRSRRTDTPCTPQPARRQGLRRSRRDRLAAGLINALHRRARRRRHLAMPATPGARLARRQRPARLSARRTHMYAFDYQRPTSRDAAKAAAAGADARYLAGGQSLIQAMRLRLVAVRARWSTSAAIADLKGIKADGNGVDDRRDGDARRRSPNRRRAARRCRRSPSSPAASAIRWCATWARSAARSPTPIRRPAIRPACSALGATVHTDRRTIAADEFFTGLYETALQPGELITAVAFPGGAEGGVRQVQAAGVALRARRRVRRADRRRRARRR